MSPSASRGPTPQPIDSADNGLRIKIMSPSPDVPPNLSFVVEPTSTVDELKQKIQTALDAHPALDQQKLIYRGKVLDGNAQLGPTVIGNADRESSYTLHLVVKPAPNATAPSYSAAPANLGVNTSNSSNQPPTRPVTNPFVAPGLTPTSPITRTTTTASYRSGPSTITTTTTRIAASFSASPGVNPLAQLAGLVPPLVATGTGPQVHSAGPHQPGQANIQLAPELADRINEQIRNMLQGRANDPGTNPEVSTGASQPGSEARGNTTSHESSTSGPQRSELNMPGPVDGTHVRLPSVFTTPVLPSAAPQLQPTIPRTLNDILNQASSSAADPNSDPADRRRRALQSSLRDLEQENGAHTRLPNLSPAIPSHIYQTPSAAEPILYMLRDPQGRPHSLILPPNFHASPTQNPFIQPGISSSGYFHATPPMPPAMGFQPAIPGHVAPPHDLNGAITAPLIQQLDSLTRNLEALTARMRQAEARAAANNGGMNGMNVQQLGQRVRERAGHLWLAMKLAVFVFLFAGHGEWSRILYLGSIAVLIFLWQTGLARPLIEAFYPPPPQPRAIPGVLPQRQAQANQPNQPAQANAPNAPVNNPVDPIDPARTAQIIIERHEGTSRRIFRAFENGVGLFIASLVPGLHERHVEAAERREMELRRAREGAQAGTGQEGQNPGEDQAQPTPAPEFQSAEQPQQPQEPAPMGHPEQPQDQDNLRRRNLRARVDDAEDEARNAGIAGPVGVGAGFTF